MRTTTWIKDEESCGEVVLKHPCHSLNGYKITITKPETKDCMGVKVSEPFPYLTICYDNIAQFSHLVPARAVRNDWNLSVTVSSAELNANVDTLNVWADLGGQDRLYLYGFLDNALWKILDNKDPWQKLGQVNKWFIVLSAAKFLSQRDDIRKALEPDTYGELLYYCIENKAILGINDLSDKAVSLWLQFCMDEESQAWFKSPKSPDRYTSLPPDKREAEVEKFIAISGDLKDRAQLWLMRWYNIEKVAELRHPDSPWVRRALLYLPEVIASLILLYCLAHSERIVDIWRIFPNYDTASSWFVALLYVSGVIAAVFMINEKGRVGSSSDTQIMLPRLAASIIVGYFALMGSDSWKIIADNSIFLSPGNNGSNFSWWTVVVRIVAPLLAAFLYIVIEVGRKPGIRMTRKKAQIIFCRGYAYAVILGVVISDVFGNALLSENTKPYGFPGVAGVIYPEMILYLAPVAFFIGLFLQLLWDDKSLTDRITEGM